MIDCFVEDYGANGAFRKALENNPHQTADIIIGHLSPEREKILDELFALFPGRLNIKLSQESSKHHMQIIGNNIYIESEHEQDEPYECAYVVEGASEEGLRIAKRDFGRLGQVSIPITH